MQNYIVDCLHYFLPGFHHPENLHFPGPLILDLPHLAPGIDPVIPHSVPGSVLAAALAAAVIFYFLYRKNIKRFTKYLEEAVENNNFSSELYPDSYLKRHSAIVESIADKNEDNGIIYLTCLDKLWINQLKTYPSEKMLKKVLVIA